MENLANRDLSKFLKKILCSATEKTKQIWNVWSVTTNPELGITEKSFVDLYYPRDT